jgi:hypothetical protein
LAALPDGLLDFPALSDVTGEAASVDETPIHEVGARVDEDVLDRLILGAQPGFIVVQRFSSRQASQDVSDDVAIDVEVRHGLAEIFALCVSEQVHIGAVRPKNGAVGTDAMQAEVPVLEKVAQLPFTLQQLLLALARLPQRSPEGFNRIVSAARLGRILVRARHHTRPSRSAAFASSPTAADTMPFMT